MTQALDRLIQPRSLALIGASAEPGAVGDRVARHLLEHLRTTHEVAANLPSLYFVNPRHDQIQDFPCLRSVKSLPAGVDLAILVTPWAVNLEVIAQLHELGVGAIVCISVATESRFVGLPWQSRKSLLNSLRRRLDRSAQLFVGPASFGVQLPHLAVNASLLPALPRAGGIVLITDCEALSTVFNEYCLSHELGVRAIVTLGDSLDINAAELLDYFARDGQASTVMVHIDIATLASEHAASEFYSSLRACAWLRQVVVWPTLDTEIDPSEGEALLSRVLSQIAASRAMAVTELQAFCAAAQLSQFSSANGARAAAPLLLVGNGASALSLSVQQLPLRALERVQLDAASVRELRPALVKGARLSNPLDLGRAALPSAYALVRAKARADWRVVYCHHANTLANGVDVARALIASQPAAERTDLAIFFGQHNAPARRLLIQHGFAGFASPESAFAALADWRQYLALRRRRVAAPPSATLEEPEIWLSASGMRMVLREIHSLDEQALRQSFARLSAEEVRMRFLHPLKALSQESAMRLCDLDAQRELALVLSDRQVPGQAQIYAVVRASRTPSYSHRKRVDAEFAIVVPRALAGQGLGKRLMRALMQRAKQMGIERLWGDVLHENAPMLALARSLGFAVEKHPEDGHIVRVSRAL